MKKELIMFSDYICPWCYFSLNAMGNLAKKYNLKLHRKAFQIIKPDIDVEKGFSMVEYDKLGGTSKQEREQKDHFLASLIEENNLPWNPSLYKHRFYQTSRSHTVAKWISAHGYDEEDYHRSIFLILGTKNANIAKFDVIAEVLRGMGIKLSINEIEDITKNPIYRNQFLLDLSFGQSLGIRGVPSYIYNDKIFPGYRNKAQLEEMIESEN